MESLLEPADLELIRRLTLSVKRRAAGQATGEQRSPALGGGIEFADYRDYTPGDDVRQVDWSVFLRFRKLLVKLCAEEKELTLVILVDHSRSMAYGDAPKFRQAQKMAAILGGIALASGNRAGVLAWGDDLKEVTSPLRGQRSVPWLADRIRRLQPADEGRPLACLRQFASRYGRRCLAVLLTDLLHPQWPQLLTGLGSSGGEVHVIQILAPEELRPSQRGEITLVDSETGAEAALHVDGPLLDRYHEQVSGWLAQVGAQCRAGGLGYALVRSDAPLPRVFLDDLKKAGLVC
jgi:uncharacterized protein (DUF58 family)